MQKDNHYQSRCTRGGTHGRSTQNQTMKSAQPRIHTRAHRCSHGAFPPRDRLQLPRHLRVGFLPPSRVGRQSGSLGRIGRGCNHQGCVRIGHVRCVESAAPLGSLSGFDGVHLLAGERGGRGTLTAASIMVVMVMPADGHLLAAPSDSGSWGDVHRARRGGNGRGRS